MIDSDGVGHPLNVQFDAEFASANVAARNGVATAQVPKRVVRRGQRKTKGKMKKQENTPTVVICHSLIRLLQPFNTSSPQDHGTSLGSC